MRRDGLCLADIVEAAGATQRFMEGIRREDFINDELGQSAMVQKLTVVGETAARLSTDFRECHPEIEWADIVGFRNPAVHECFVVDWSTVWVAATQDAPDVGDTVARILAEEHSD
jgi:uncharacterized protein with HEPN domain